MGARHGSAAWGARPWSTACRHGLRCAALERDHRVRSQRAALERVTRERALLSVGLSKVRLKYRVSTTPRPARRIDDATPHAGLFPPRQTFPAAPDFSRRARLFPPFQKRFPPSSTAHASVGFPSTRLFNRPVSPAMRGLSAGQIFRSVVTFICDTSFPSPTAPNIVVTSIGGYMFGLLLSVACRHSTAHEVLDGPVCNPGTQARYV